MAASQPEADQMEVDTPEFHSGGSRAHLCSTAAGPWMRLDYGASAASFPA